jgi:hypothetical protein
MLELRKFLINITIEAHDYTTERKSNGQDNKKLSDVH